MGLFRRNHEIQQEDDGELKNSLGELECEDAIMQDKEEFGRVRNNMMKYLRAKHGDKIANRSLWRVNKRQMKGYFKDSKNKFI